MLVIVGCGKRKREMRCEAAALYTGSLSKDHMKLAQRQAGSMRRRSRHRANRGGPGSIERSNVVPTHPDPSGIPVRID